MDNKQKPINKSKYRYRNFNRTNQRYRFVLNPNFIIFLRHDLFIFWKFYYFSIDKAISEIMLSVW